MLNLLHYKFSIVTQNLFSDILRGNYFPNSCLEYLE